MSDIIKLLPNSIANQIAAGEVVQRPASVVKELMENAIDAGSTSVKVIIRDGGKTLIQIVDDGCGMSETDARMCFERHATSKIRESKDLFAIRTLGFRGEAMASIAAVAQVEMKTRRPYDEMGTRIVIEGSDLQLQEPCQTQAGTSIGVKNLFYNVPARRNFLKSETHELRLIIEEFQHIALANPDVFFSLHHQNEEKFHLTKSNLRQRIVGLNQTSHNSKLVSIIESTDLVKFEGFIGKPELASKYRGDQYFFVNKRFIKSSYLYHAVQTAYEGLIPENHHPFFVIFIDVNPEHIDVNVHPTKQEIKFDDERAIYRYLQVAVRHALGIHQITPSLDFEQDGSFSAERGFNLPAAEKRTGGSASGYSAASLEKITAKTNVKNWEKLFEGIEVFSENDSEEPTSPEENATQGILTLESAFPEDETGQRTQNLPIKEPYQIHNNYIICPIRSGFFLIDQQAAHEKILYDRYLQTLTGSSAPSQRLLFPQTMHFSLSDAEILKEILLEVNTLGFDVQEFGSNTFVINGLPADISSAAKENDGGMLLNQLIAQYKANLDLKINIKENIARSMARGAAVKRGQLLNPTEMQSLIDQLFACVPPFISPSGRQCLITFELDDLEKRFHA